MKLRLFEFADKELLDPDLSCDDNAYISKLNDYARKFLSLDNRQIDDSFDISSLELDNAATLHCDKWLEETGLHMMLYSGSTGQPKINTPETDVLKNYPVAHYRNYSGDVSGVIGEAIFSLLLTKKFLLGDGSFAHFGANRATGIFPDFGIYVVTKDFQSSFSRAMQRISFHASIELSRTHIIPAEVKSMANPNFSIIKDRFDKAVQQIRNFWSLRNNKSVSKRGASIIFLALRNENYYGYDGVILWMI